MIRCRHLLLLSLLLVNVSAVSAKVIHREKSLYRNIEVKEERGRRCLVFAVRKGDRNQSCMNISQPKHIVFPYAQMTFAGLLLNDEPASILVIGLGGGSIPLALSELYPEAQIDVVEIDAAVDRVAREYFGFKETERMRVHVQDARVFIKRAAIRKQRYDLILLDAFNGDYIPEHLMTVEFLEEVKASLDQERGVLVANTFARSRLYDHESTTYQAVYGDFYNLKMPNTGNRVIIAALGGLVDRGALRSRARRLSGALTTFRVPIEDFPVHMDRGIDWDRTARPLTDQYSPANLLRGD